MPRFTNRPCAVLSTHPPCTRSRTHSQRMCDPLASLWAGRAGLCVTEKHEIQESLVKVDQNVKLNQG